MRSIFMVLILLAAAGATMGQGLAAVQYFESGISAARMGRFAEARDAFDRSRVEAERDGAAASFMAKIHFNLGVVNYQLRDLKPAVAEFSAAIRNSKIGYENAWYSLGMALADLGRLDEAQAAFETATKLNPRNGETWFDLAFIHLRLNDNAKAQIAFQNSIRYGCSESPMSHNNLGVLLAWEGRFAAAEKELEIAARSSGGTEAMITTNLKIVGQLKRIDNALVAAADLRFTSRKSLFTRN